MSTSVREKPEEQGVELGTGVSWPLAFTAGGLGLLVFATGTILAVLAAMRHAPESEPVTAQHDAAPAKVQQPLPVRLPATIELVQMPVAEAAGPELLPPPAFVPPPIARATALEPPSYLDVVAEAKPPPAVIVKRRQTLTEEELRAALTSAPEVDLETEKGTTAKIIKQMGNPTRSKSIKVDDEEPNPDPRPPKAQPALELFAARADLRGLPVRNAPECQADVKEARAVDKLSRVVRGFSISQDKRRNSEFTTSYALSRDVALTHFLARPNGKNWGDNMEVRTLVQMLQTEDDSVRRMLVGSISATKGPSTTAILAQRAIFDLSPSIREAAVKELKARPTSEYRDVLLGGLRYPWAPAADHAAEALVALKDRDAVRRLVGLLDQPDPRAPTRTKDGKWVAPELVRLNHLGNCLLCHGPSASENDLARAIVPLRGEELPVPNCGTLEGYFVRADVTYLKQDFSVMQAVEKPDKWPKMQRFDYLIQNRELSADEAERLTKERKATYPQREAVLWALRELTDQDMGDKSDDWYLLLMEQSLWRND
jgi:hypothetical protein